MGKLLRPLAVVAAVAVNVIPGVGQAISGGIIGALGGTFAAAGIASVLTPIILGGVTLGGLAALGGGRGRAPVLSAFDPKSINPDPNAPRMIVFGRTVFPVVLRHAEPSGNNQEFIDYVFRLASHKSDAIEEVWIEDRLAWTSAGGAQGIYSGYLTIEVILEAGPAAFHTVNGGATWGSQTRLTGCTTMKVRVKRSDNGKNSRSPFASGISGRWAVIGRGMPVYDPALDSTVPGGSGSQRAHDNSTWAYTVTIARGNNPALQLLAYLLGWRINGVGSVGCGLPADVIDLVSFAEAAAICDEPIALAAGGTQRRFESGRAFSDDDDPLAVIGELLKAMNGELVDDGGLLQLRIGINDLTPAFTLTDGDFVSGYDWRPQPDQSQQFTVVRGSYSEPASPTLFSSVNYPQVTIPRTSLVPRAMQLDLSCVQDQRRAERIAKQAGQRNLYSGQFEVTLGLRGWLLKRNMVVQINSSVRGWTGRLFRVRELTFNADGTVSTTLQEENQAIYAWDADESAVVTPVAPQPFDSRAAASWLMGGIEPAATRNEDAGNLLPQSVSLDDGQGFGGGVIDRPIGASGRPAELVRAQLIDDGAGVHWTGPAGVPVSPGDVISYRHYALTDFTNADNCRANVNFLASDGSIAATIDLPTTELTGAVALSTWFLREARFTVPADVVAMRIYVIRAGGSGGSFFIGEPWASRAEMGADVTAVAVPSLDTPAGQTFFANHLGTLNPGQLPRAVQARRRRGGVDVSSSTTWSVSTVNCTATINSIGVITITDVLGTGSITVISTREGVELRGAFEIIVQTAAPPAGTGGTSASDSSLASIFGNSTWTDISTVLTITTGSAGQAQLSAPLAFGVGFINTPGLSYFGCQLRWRRETSPGVWTVVKTVSELSGAVVGWDDDFGEYARENGAITCNEMLTGLGASTTHSFQLQAFASTGAGLATFFFGTASAVGS